jgi:hypothetical protein
MSLGVLNGITSSVSVSRKASEATVDIVEGANLVNLNRCTNGGTIDADID